MFMSYNIMLYVVFCDKHMYVYIYTYTCYSHIYIHICVSVYIYIKYIHSTYKSFLSTCAYVVVWVGGSEVWELMIL